MDKEPDAMLHNYVSDLGSCKVNTHFIVFDLIWSTYYWYRSAMCATLISGIDEISFGSKGIHANARVY